MSTAPINSVSASLLICLNHLTLPWIRSTSISTTEPSMIPLTSKLLHYSPFIQMVPLSSIPVMQLSFFFVLNWLKTRSVQTPKCIWNLILLMMKNFREYTLSKLICCFRIKLSQVVPSEVFLRILLVKIWNEELFLWEGWGIREVMVRNTNDFLSVFEDKSYVS